MPTHTKKRNRMFAKEVAAIATYVRLVKKTLPPLPEFADDDDVQFSLPTYDVEEVDTITLEGGAE